MPLRGHENSDTGGETPVPALFLGRGCSSTPSSRLGPGASTRGISAISFGNQYRPFPQQRFRHVDVARADGEVLEMFVTEPGQMLRESLLQAASHSLRAPSAISAALRFDLSRASPCSGTFFIFH